jgi:hypothetical protein
VRKDLLAGLIFLGFGVLAVLVARAYPMGTAMRMGPGYFPTVLGGILVVFGVILAMRGIRSGDKVAGEWGWRPLALIAVSMVLFGYLLPRHGLVPALVVMFFVAAFAGREFRWKEVLVLTSVMTLFAVVVFLHLLKLPYPWIS